MVKITYNRIKYSSFMVSTILVLSAVLVAGCVGSKVPQTQLDFQAMSATGLIITNNGGDTLTLKDEIITVKKQVNDKVVDGLDAVQLYGNDPEFQDAPAVEKLEPGRKIKHSWRDSLSIGEVLVITIQDRPSGKIISKTISVS